MKTFIKVSHFLATAESKQVCFLPVLLNENAPFLSCCLLYGSLVPECR